MFQILKNGGILMIPIIACGLLVVFIVAERLHYFFTVKKRKRLFPMTLIWPLETETMP